MLNENDIKNMPIISGLRKAIVRGESLKTIKKMVQHLSENEMKRIMNYHTISSHLTILNLSLCMDKTYNRQYVIYLLENGADPNLEFEKTYSELIRETMTVTMLESRCGNVENIALLIKYGGDIYKKDKNGKNSLDHAIEGQNLDIIRKLKKKKRMDCLRIIKIFYKISNLNKDCIQHIVSFCF
jgi:hypothetical protein